MAADSAVVARLLTAAMSRRREDDKPQVAIDVTLEPSSSSSGPGGRGSSSLRQSLEDYCRRCLLGDVVAGVTVGSVLVPQSMAYALLAGLPPEMGLYSSLMPLIAYSIFGSSPHLAVGPVSVVCVLIAVQMSELNVPEDDKPAVAVLLALLSGVVLCLMGVARLGFLACILSHAVLSGFMTAVSFIIAIEQLDTFLGFKVDTPNGKFLAKVVGIVGSLDRTNKYSVALSVSTAAILIASNQLQKRWPTQVWPKATTLVLTLAGTFLSWAASLEALGVQVVGTLPRGLPSPHLPELTFARAVELLPAVAMLVLVGFVESIAVAKTIASKVGYEIDADREMLGLGLSNIAAAFCGGFPSFGSLSRTPVNYMAGARTRFAGVVTALLSLLVVLLLTPCLRYLPKAVMAAIIIVAVSQMANFGELLHIARLRKAEVALWVMPFLGTLFIGIDAGLLGSLVVCLLLTINHASLAHATLHVAPASARREDEYVERYIFASQTPPPPPASLTDSKLGRSLQPALEVWQEVQDPSLGCCYGGGRKAQAQQVALLVAGAGPTNGLPVLRLQCPLFYANASMVRNAIEVVAYTAFPLGPGGQAGAPRAVLLHMHAVTSIDSSALHLLHQVVDALRIAGGVRLAVVHVNAKVLSGLSLSKLTTQSGGPILVFDTVEDATTHFAKEL